MGSSTLNSKIELCYNAGVVTVSGTSIQAGGIVGNASHMAEYDTLVEIYDCYNIGNITGRAVYGIVAWERSVTIKNCYNIGTLTGTSLGGIIGSYADNLSLSNCYWLESCGADYGIFSAQSDENAESKSSDEMKLLVTTLGEEWKEDEGSINKGYPILQWQ